MPRPPSDFQKHPRSTIVEFFNITKLLKFVKM